VSYTGAANILSRQIVTGTAGAEEEILLNLDQPVPTGEVIAQNPGTQANVLQFQNIEDLAGPFLPLTPGLSPAWPTPPPAAPAAPSPIASRHDDGGTPGLVEHLVSDVGLGADGQQIYEPVWARDETMRDPQRGGSGIVRDFDDSEFLQPQDIIIQSFRDGAVGADPDIVFDTRVESRYRRNGMWHPDLVPGLVPQANPDEATLPGVSAGAQLTEYLFPSTHPKNESGTNFEFFFFDGSLYYARVADLSSPWYRNVRPWAFELREIFAQRGNVTITSNVINPNQGDRATLNYVLDDASMVRINVFNVAGDLIDILESSRKEAGEHSTTWDGTNRQGQPVARGIYFIRVMADGLDEYRKVMVVK
jgi:hypothetical protein